MKKRRDYIDASKIRWRTGTPVEPDWYLSSASQDHNCWRWWDGERWSRPAFPCQNAEQAGAIAEIKEIHPLGTAGLFWAARPI